jgi:hypothetical protein
MLFHPGGFREEFHRLRIPRVAAQIFGLLLLLAWLAGEGGQGAAMDLLVVALLTYMFAGLAVCHERVRTNKRSVAWLFGLYVVMVALPQVAITGLAALGLADTFVDFRKLGYAPGSGRNRE